MAYSGWVKHYSLADGAYISPKKTRLNRLRYWVAMRVFEFILPKPTELWSVKTASGSSAGIDSVSLVALGWP